MFVCQIYLRQSGANGIAAVVRQDGLVIIVPL